MSHIKILHSPLDDEINKEINELVGQFGIETNENVLYAISQFLRF